MLVKSAQPCANKTASTMRIFGVFHYMPINSTGIFANEGPHKISGFDHSLAPERMDFIVLSQENWLGLRARRMFAFV